MNNSGLVKNNQQSYYHLNFYERASERVPPPFPFWLDWEAMNMNCVATGAARLKMWILKPQRTQGTTAVNAETKYVQRGWKDVYLWTRFLFSFCASSCLHYVKLWNIWSTSQPAVQQTENNNNKAVSEANNSPGCWGGKVKEIKERWGSENWMT